jgi:hypothetical protein
MESMWEMLAAPVWDCVDEEMLARVVAGQPLVVREDMREKEAVVERRMGTRRTSEGTGRPVDSGRGRVRCGSSSSEGSPSISEV